MRAETVHLARPSGAVDTLPLTLAVHVVEVREVEPPEGEEPVHWVLYTQEPIETAADLLRIVALYTTRWVIEESCKALKTGCAYEARQLESYDALRVLLAMLLPIATRVLSYRTLAHHTPALAAEHAADEETRQLLAASPRVNWPKAPTVKDLLWAIAALGGHRPSNGEPGWQTLLRGMEVLELQRQGFRAARDYAAASATRKGVHS